MIVGKFFRNPLLHLSTFHVLGFVAIFFAMLKITPPEMGASCAAFLLTGVFAVYSIVRRNALSPIMTVYAAISIMPGIVIAAGASLNMLDVSADSNIHPLAYGYLVGIFLFSLVTCLINERLMKKSPYMAVYSVSVAMCLVVLIIWAMNNIPYWDKEGAYFYKWPEPLLFGSLFFLLLPILRNCRQFPVSFALAFLNGSIIGVCYFTNSSNEQLLAFSIAILNCFILPHLLRLKHLGLAVISLVMILVGIMIIIASSLSNSVSYLVLLLLLISFFVYTILIIVRYLRRAASKVLACRKDLKRHFLQPVNFLVSLVRNAWFRMNVKKEILQSSAAVFCIIIVAPYFMLLTNTLWQRPLTRLAASFYPFPINEEMFIKIAMNDVYLWYDHVKTGTVPYKNPNDFLTDARYRKFDKDFNYVQTVEEDDASGQGRIDGLGMKLVEQEGRLFVGFVYEKSPAAKSGLARGWEVLKVGDKSWEEIKRRRETEEMQKELNAVKLKIVDQEGQPRDIVLNPGLVEADRVYGRVIKSNERNMGYLLINSFNFNTIKQAKPSILEFTQENISELILDLRYNGGGTVVSAVQLASIIGGKKVEGRVCGKLVYNDRYKSDDVSSFPKEAHSLNLKRLIVLTTANTASASEMIINGLRPYMPVYVIGEQTYGKPVGQMRFDYGNNALRLITFSVYNAKNQGGYFDGISPDCHAEDNLKYSIGGEDDRLLSKALGYINTGFCFPDLQVSGRSHDINKLGDTGVIEKFPD